MTSSQTLPPPQGPEYTRCGCGHIEPEHRPDAGPCLVCDCAAYRPAAAPAVQAPATDRAAPTDWVNGHPQLEAIAAAVWERCGRSDSGMCVEDDPRNIAVAAYAAVLAELPAPVDRAAVPAAVPGQADGETAGEAPRCDVEFEGGGQCTKAAGHRTPQNQDPHTPPAAGAQQPKEARP